MLDKYIIISQLIFLLKGYYSQEGEDIFLSKYFKKKKNGLFVDIGAHHPTRFSNTYLFYKSGWRGINIDATPGSMNLFSSYRPKDINIEAAVSNKTKKIKYYIFDEPALNSFSKLLSKTRETSTKYKIIKTVELVPKKLSEILDKNVQKNQIIDFMSIDVEGHEYEVLKSNNWSKYRPTFLLVETLEVDTNKKNVKRVLTLLRKNNYKIVGSTGRTTIFKLNK